MLKRSLLVSMVVMLAAASAHAASVSVVGFGLAEPGETITLRVFVSVTPADGFEAGIFGGLVYPSSGIVTPVTVGTQYPLPSDPDFAPGALSCTSVRCFMFSQSRTFPQQANVTNFLIAEQNYTISPVVGPGTVLTWSWQTSPSTQVLDFFNAVPMAPALQITVGQGVIPEPSTAALLGVGLLGLAAARRRR